MRSLVLTVLIGSVVTLPVFGQNLLENSSFEEPRISGRTPEGKGGNPVSESDSNPWALFAAQPATEGGQLTIGLTDEIARTGAQSMFVDFEKLTASEPQAALMTKLVPIKPSQAYRVSIWGRVDRKRPLALDERQPYMVLDVDYFADDQKTAVSEGVHGAQLIPGTIVPGGPHPLVFVSSKWSESFARVTAPPGAALMRVTWSWRVPPDGGETDGVIYWDDAAIEQEQAATAPKAEAEKVPPESAPSEPGNSAEKK